MFSIGGIFIEIFQVMTPKTRFKRVKFLRNFENPVNHNGKRPNDRQRKPIKSLYFKNWLIGDGDLQKFCHQVYWAPIRNIFG